MLCKYFSAISVASSSSSSYDDDDDDDDDRAKSMIVQKGWFFGLASQEICVCATIVHTDL